MNRKILFWILAMLLPLSEAAATASLSIESFNISGGETKEMVINLDNPSTDITLVQFDLRLPDGLTLKQTDGEYDIDIAGRTTWRKHSLDANVQADGSIRFLLASSSNAVLSGYSGAVIKMTLVASNSFNGGDIKLENILMVSPDEQETKQATYTYTISPTPPPPTGTATLSIEPFTIPKGGEATMLIDVNNPDNEVTLVQFDLRLPAGLTLKQVDGEYDIDIAGRTTWRKHSLDANLQSDGSIRFLLASNSNAALSGTSGAVIKMTLQANNTFSGGIVQLENALLVSPDETESKPNTYQYEVKASSTETSFLSIEPFSISAGETKEMVIDLTNPDDEITLVQFDLRLPNGLTIAIEDGEYAIDIAGRTTWKKHSLDANATDGIVRFLLSSTKNAVLEGTSGAIISIKLIADNSFTGGSISLENILLVTPNEKELKPANVEYTIQPVGDIAINATNFPDKNFRDFLLKQSYGMDGVITKEEIDEIKKMDVSGKEIESLKGIEFFTALTELICGYDRLTSLDVSKNTALISLECRYTQLTSLDVSKNTALTYLYCWDNHLLTSLDVSKNTALTTLFCDNNQLTSLDVSNNPALTWIYCPYNQLTSLDVSNDTALKILECDSNQLTSLDVSKNTALTTLTCENNQLTSLDVSKNTMLKLLRFSSNHLSTIDISKNTALTDLICSSNQLISLDVSKNAALKYITCDLNMIKGVAMDALINSLPYNSSSNDYGSLKLINDSNEEGNVCTVSQVAAAKSKGWGVLYYNNEKEKWLDYEGSPSGINDVINDSNTRNIPVYTISGQRLTAPRKGVNIVGGKKVVVR